MIVDSHSAGLVASLKRWTDCLLGLVQSRGELFAVEVREERAQAINLLIHVSTALFLGMMSVLALTLTLIFMSPSEWRVYVAGAFCILYCGGAVWAFSSLRARLRHYDNAFAETVREFKKDRELLQGP